MPHSFTEEEPDMPQKNLVCGRRESFQTTSHTESNHLKGERFETVKPKNSNILGSNILAFVDQTQAHIDYTAKKGERYETKRPESSDVWKVVILLQ
ncbi:hypothetical protein AB6A40_011433 [Gnathostoma spinigerum]|uniref:Uncharacterized protein n=1 Tax=Gnathostoma spinigerum TaxID=75299 RepID=A0ABD6F3D0_9BILA